MGLFITLEGGEGSGKTSILKEIASFLQENNLEFITSREPGGINISEQIRSVILNENNTLMDPVTETLLFAASRRQHLVEKIIPALNKNKIVVCDRYIDSSMVYQGFVRGVGIEKVFEVNKLAVEKYLPDLTILLDIDPEIGLKRVFENRGNEVNRIDHESLEFHKKIREGYNFIANLEKNKNKIIKVDASKSFNEVKKSVIDIIKDFLLEKKKING